MVGRGSAVNVSEIVIIAILLASCSSVPAQSDTVESFGAALPILAIPGTVQRMAVLYPRGSNPEWSVAYSRLEGAAFQLKAQRPTLKIVDRSNIPTVFSEQQFQVGGLVSDDSAVHVGHMLGVDSVLIYRIDGPTLRDRFWARQLRDLPPITVTSKIIRVESAEVVYHNVVTARPDGSGGSRWALSEELDYQRWSREALERGVVQTVSDLRRAFQ